MSRIVRERYPVAKLPEEFRRTLFGCDDVTLTIDFGAEQNLASESAPRPQRVKSLEELFAMADAARGSPDDVATLPRSIQGDASDPRQFPSDSPEAIETSRLNENERRLLSALAWMCEQYLRRGVKSGSHLSGERGYLDHMCMSAGENAVELLVAHGLVEPDFRGGTWTAAGRAFLDLDF